ncbi:tetraacyldisaccharide 4'-kinase [Thiomicrospira microaerophila]|uniref:tetraacyldisaccharide 4'-kinase n=1 Tax=Thiomicrospira microaerophila TaxID=406020 RepID=UPI0005CA5418|nr:tetraacyldisaccharide 4'-kinase [Thiomicrospira microaerophila]
MSWPSFWLKADWRSTLLSPLAKLVCSVAAKRLAAFKRNPPEAPGLVVVVGNIVVGGAGKTPFIIWLGQRLQQKGWRFGVISRGYAGQSKTWPQTVSADTDPHLVGDEPVLLAQTLGCPVVVSPKRAEALAMIQARYDLDLVISDDGLQHYALARDIEIVLFDASRPNQGLGNGLCMPAGPLREPVERLAQVDFVVLNGENLLAKPDFKCQYLAQMQIKPLHFYRLTDVKDCRPINAFAGQTGYAVAGIGHPQRFYQTLDSLGIVPIPLDFADHHAYQLSDFAKLNRAMPLFMTSKDAVKCQTFAQPNWWVLAIAPECDADFEAALMSKIEQQLALKRPQKPISNSFD